MQQLLVWDNSLTFKNNIFIFCHHQIKCAPENFDYFSLEKLLRLDIAVGFYGHTVGPRWMNINDWLIILFVRQHTQCCGVSKCYTMGWRICQFTASAMTNLLRLGSIIMDDVSLDSRGEKHAHAASWRKLFLSFLCLRCHQSAAHFKGSNTFDCFFLASICSPCPFMFSDGIFANQGSA